MSQRMYYCDNTSSYECVAFSYVDTLTRYVCVVLCFERFLDMREPVLAL